VIRVLASIDDAAALPGLLDLDPTL
jgi:hypothetical protein